MKQLLGIFACALFLLGCSPSEKDENTLIIGTNGQYYPYEFKEEGELKGYDIELGKELGALLEKKIKWVDMDFDALIISLQQGKVDMIMAGISITPEREQAIWMIPYQGGDSKVFYVVYSEKMPFKKSWDDPSLKVAVEVSTLQYTFMKNAYPEVKVTALGNYSDMLLELKAKKVDAIVMEPHVYQGLKAKDASLVYETMEVPPQLQGKGNGIGMLKTKEGLKTQIESALKALKENGTLASLESKWFGGAL